MHQLHEDLSRSQDFGNYHLEKLVGRGGMGEVWLARHRLLRRDAAVKLVSAGLLEHAGHSERRHLKSASSRKRRRSHRCVHRTR
jgi:serine/threonine-protein kinase